jgi:crotonobetainyl-CoA:carnitine CoA-transferase CaiB-like acyl-CoA transferase
MRDFLGAARRGERPQRLGNGDPRIPWQGVLAAEGEDRWVAVSLFDDADRAKFAAIVGPDPAAWFAARKDHAIAAELQSAGVAAGVLQDAEDMIERDPQLAERGALVMLEHAVLGPFGHMATPIRFSHDRFEPFRAPSMGEHAEEIARTLCGLPPERIAELSKEGVFE